MASSWGSTFGSVRISNESELIGDQQSMYWPGQYIDPNFCSSTATPSFFDLKVDCSHITSEIWCNMGPHKKRKIHLGSSQACSIIDEKAAKGASSISEQRGTGSTAVAKNAGGDSSPYGKSTSVKLTKNKSKPSLLAYARNRREKISQRLRILQNLVPNGSKVDISTMLEEAANYVKFLQLQIKFLSSNELWMYAPFSYGRGDTDFIDHLNLLLS